MFAEHEFGVQMADRKTYEGIVACDCDHRFKPRLHRRKNPSGTLLYVKCINCGNESERVEQTTSYYESRQKAIDLWNRK
jgi:hypothetical protein